MVLFLMTKSAVADEKGRDELRLKTAYLVNFARFVYWPTEEVGNMLQICIFDGDSFTEMAAELKPPQIQQRSVVLQVFPANAEVPQYCNLIYVSNGHRRDWGKIFKSIKGRAVLTVGEEDDFIAYGGIIRFFNENGKLRFAADPARAKSYGVQLSAKLLDLAKIELASDN